MVIAAMGFVWLRGVELLSGVVTLYTARVGDERGKRYGMDRIGF